MAELITVGLWPAVAVETTLKLHITKDWMIAKLFVGNYYGSCNPSLSCRSGRWSQRSGTQSTLTVAPETDPWLCLNKGLAYALAVGFIRSLYDRNLG